MLTLRSLVLVWVVGTSCFAASPNKSDLLNTTLDGWKFVTREHMDVASICELNADQVLVVKGKPVGYIQTAGSFENYRLHAEWRWSAKPGNGGVLVHISSGPIDRDTWPRCFQIQLKHGSAGDVLPMAEALFAEPLAPAKPGSPLQRPHAAPASEKPGGEWNSCDIVCRGTTIEVTINGVLQNRVTQCRPSSGRIGFQLESAPFELRNVQLDPLDL